MRTWAMLAILTITAVAFAGCSGDKDGDGGSASSSSSSASSATGASSSASASASKSATSTTSSSSSTSTAPTNAPPTGAINATVNGTAVSFTLTGSDPDGDAVVWDLTFGDGASTNGTTLPATVNHTYAIGNYTVNYTVTDGKDPKTYDIDLAIVGGSSSQVVKTVEWMVGTTWCVEYPYGAQSQADGSPTPFMHGTPAAGVLYGELAVDPAWAGKAYVADFGSPATPLDAGIVAFYDADDEYLDLGGSAGGLNGPPETAADPMVATGIIPPTAAWATFMNCANPEGIAVQFTIG